MEIKNEGNLADEIRRAAAYPPSLTWKNPSHNQIEPRYKAAKRRRLQRGLGGLLSMKNQHSRKITPVNSHVLSYRDSINVYVKPL